VLLIVYKISCNGFEVNPIETILKAGTEFPNSGAWFGRHIGMQKGETDTHDTFLKNSSSESEL
jgi:hypothetical protein